MSGNAASRARREFGATRLQSWAVAGYVYAFRLLVLGAVWAALVWSIADARGLSVHPLLAGIVLLAAFVFALGTFPFTFVAAFLGRRGEQTVLFGLGITYLALAVRIAFTRGAE